MTKKITITPIVPTVVLRLWHCSRFPVVRTCCDFGFFALFAGSALSALVVLSPFVHGQCLFEALGVRRSVAFTGGVMGTGDAHACPL